MADGAAAMNAYLYRRLGRFLQVCREVLRVDEISSTFAQCYVVFVGVLCLGSQMKIAVDGVTQAVHVPVVCVSHAGVAT